MNKKRLILEMKYEMALIRAERSDVFDIMQRMEDERQEMFHALGFTLVRDITRWVGHHYNPADRYKENR